MIFFRNFEKGTRSEANSHPLDIYDANLRNTRYSEHLDCFVIIEKMPKI